MPQAALHPILDACVAHYVHLPAEAQADFKHNLAAYGRLYSFLSQIMPFRDADLEKRYPFGRHLLRKLPLREDSLPAKLAEHIDIDSYRIQALGEDRIVLDHDADPFRPQVGAGAAPTDTTVELLSRIIQDVNERFGTDFTSADKVVIDGVRTHLATNGTLLESVRAANSRENVKLLFNSLFESAMQELLTSNFDLYKRVTDDAEFGAYFKDRLFDAVYADLRPPLASAILGSQLSGQSPTPSAHYG